MGFAEMPWAVLPFSPIVPALCDAQPLQTHSLRILRLTSSLKTPAGWAATVVLELIYGT